LVSETVFLILCVCFVLSVEMTSGKQYPRSSVEFYTRKLHDKEKGTYMGRSPTSWAKIGLFYLVFYGMLAALVAICMWVFLQTLDPRIPKWQQESSIIGTNPGLGFRPMPKNNEESTLIWLEGTNKANYLNWYDNIMEFLDSELPSVLPPLPRSLFPFQSTTRLVRSRRATPTSRPARTQSWPARRKCARST
jgi:hypothetical protein